MNIHLLASIITLSVSKVIALRIASKFLAESVHSTIHEGIHIPRYSPTLVVS